MTDGNILIVDDDPGICTSIQLFLKQYFTNVFVELNPKRIIHHFDSNQIDVVLLDMNFRKGKNDSSDGFFYQQEIKKTSPSTVVVFMTAYGDIDLAVKSIKEGVMDFVTKPWKNEKLLLTIQTAIQLAHKNQKVDRLATSEEINKSERLSILDHFIGDSESFVSTKTTLEKVAPTDASVLLLGANGTGKSLAAALIHERSNRRQEPFVCVDLGAINENLVESELFGHVRGAFTDAYKDKIGRFSLAHKGTLFLDEITNLSLSAQAKLLKVLQDQIIIPLGSNKEMRIDIRLICATNTDITNLVKEGRFRQDLLFRLNTIEVEMPPLSKRRDDIPLLIEHYISLYRKKYRKGKVSPNKTEMKKLMAYDWPGNIRELDHACERAVILADSPELKLHDFVSQKPLDQASAADSLNLKEMELTLIQRALEKHGGNISRSAKELGIDRLALYRRMEKYGI